MAISKVDYYGRTLMDLTSDTVTPETLLSGVTAHDASGAQILGTMPPGDNYLPLAGGLMNGDIWFGYSLGPRWSLSDQSTGSETNPSARLVATNTSAGGKILRFVYKDADGANTNMNLIGPDGTRYFALLSDFNVTTGSGDVSGGASLFSTKSIKWWKCGNIVTIQAHITTGAAVTTGTEYVIGTVPTNCANSTGTRLNYSISLDRQGYPMVYMKTSNTNTLYFASQTAFTKNQALNLYATTTFIVS